MLSHDMLSDLECLCMVDEFNCGKMCMLYMCLCIYAVLHVFFLCCFLFLSLFWLDESESEVMMLCCCCYKLLLLLMMREVRMRGRECDGAGAVLCCQSVVCGQVRRKGVSRGGGCCLCVD